MPAPGKTLTVLERLESQEKVNAEVQVGVNAMSTYESDETLKWAITQLAKVKHAEFPQYQGMWSGPEWKLVQVDKKVQGKGGVSFLVGDLTIGRVRGENWEVYSIRKGMTCQMDYPNTFVNIVEDEE